jgi:hypothetical protein
MSAREQSAPLLTASIFSVGCALTAGHRMPIFNVFVVTIIDCMPCKYQWNLVTTVQEYAQWHFGPNANRHSICQACCHMRLSLYVCAKSIKIRRADETQGAREAFVRYRYAPYALDAETVCLNYVRAIIPPFCLKPKKTFSGCIVFRDQFSLGSSP